jgi:hypothetical protein
MLGNQLTAHFSSPASVGSLIAGMRPRVFHV